MPIQPFDLTSLGKFDPELLICPHCRALLRPDTILGETETKPWACPICTRLFGTPGAATKHLLREHGLLRREALRTQPSAWGAFLRRLDLLGFVAGELTQGRLVEFKTLFGLLELAQECVHLITFGVISQPILTRLNTVAERVPVHVIIAHSSQGTLARYHPKLKHYPRLTVALISTERGLRRMPHQKLMVIDGLLAISGSLNLSATAWERASLGFEIVQIHAAPSDVMDLNNRFFAPVWRDRDRYRNRLWQ